MMVTVVCLYVLLYEDQLSDDPIWFVVTFAFVLGSAVRIFEISNRIE